MKLMAPSYYPAFRCTAGQCRHSCCIGWEIDIDEETLKRYRSIPDEWGKRLEENICSDGETASFRLTKDERCPFLNPQGLCDIILQFGEDALCQICTDHPRFRSFFSDRTEIGLGLCCEAAARLVLGTEEKVKMICLSDDGMEEETDEADAAFFAWRAGWMQCAQDRSRSILDRVEQIHPLAFSLKDWLPFLLSLERMDDAWAQRLQNALDAEKEWKPEWEKPFEQFLVYLLLRHLPAVMEDGDETGRLGFVVLAWKLVWQLFLASDGSMEELCEIVRLYSSEIEYSDENVGAIIARLHEMND